MKTTLRDEVIIGPEPSCPQRIMNNSGFELTVKQRFFASVDSDTQTTAIEGTHAALTKKLIASCKLFLSSCVNHCHCVAVTVHVVGEHF